MGRPDHLTRDISDTARWAAWCRSAEGDRPDGALVSPCDLGERLGRPVTPTAPATAAQREAFRMMNAHVRLDRAPGAIDGSTSS